MPIERSVLIQAAEIRARIELKLLEAVRAATAIATNYTTLLTNDKQFRTVKGLNTLLLSEVSVTFDEEE